MPTANRARVSPARVAVAPAKCPVFADASWGLLCPGVALLDELPPTGVWCGERIRSAAIEPDVVLTTGVMASDDHLPVGAVEDLDGLSLLVTERAPGSNGTLERPDLICLLRSELEDHLVAMWIVPPANDEGRGAVVDEGVELVGLEGPVS